MGNWMRSAFVTVLLGVMALGLAGCSNKMRSYLEKDTPTDTLAVRQDLTMPPDLRLPPPGTAAPAPTPAATASQAALTAPATPGTATVAAVDNGPYSVFTNAGISLYNADGTKKTDQQLRDELQAYYIAQKKAKNPSYGTVFNIGNIFKDE